MSPYPTNPFRRLLDRAQATIGARQLAAHEARLEALNRLDPGHVPLPEDDPLAGAEQAPPLERPGDDATFNDQDVDNLAHDMAQVFLQQVVTMHEWHGEFMNTPGGLRDAYRRLARFILGSVAGMAHETEGGHTGGDDCPECEHVFGFLPLQAMRRAAEHEGPPAVAGDTPVGEFHNTAATAAEGPFQHLVFHAPPGTPGPEDPNHDPEAWRPIGWVTEAGFIPADGVHITDEQRARLDEYLGAQLGRDLSNPFDALNTAEPDRLPPMPPADHQAEAPTEPDRGPNRADYPFDAQRGDAAPGWFTILESMNGGR